MREKERVKDLWRLAEKKTVVAHPLSTPSAGNPKLLTRKLSEGDSWTGTSTWGRRDREM